MLRNLILIACLALALRADNEPSPRVIAFYYGWYANPQIDGAYEHWNSPVFQRDNNAPLKQFPGGGDIGANFYPKAGTYSVNDPETLDRQMRELVDARVGVVAASWWGEDTFTGQNLPKLLDAAHGYGLQVCIHIEPFGGRDAKSTGQAIRTLIDKYGSHPAFFRSPEAGRRPVFFVYDSYLTPAKEWADLLSPAGKDTIRNSKYDSAVIGLWVKENDGRFMTEGHFDGFYTYFASDGFVYGSTTKHWTEMARFARDNKLLFIPSVGPGYIDTRIRPWNSKTTRSRDGGRYYDKMFQAAIECAPRLISITSYNEWHEGTQIEPAVPKKIDGYSYESYEPHAPEYYLERTAHWVEQFESKVQRPVSLLERTNRAGGEPYPFFPFCIDWHDAKKRSFEQQAAMLKDLGFEGVGHIWLDNVAERLKTLDSAGLKLFQITMNVEVGQGKPAYDERFKDVLALVKGRHVQFCLIVNGMKPSDPSVDPHAVTILRELSDLAEGNDVQLLLYPHQASWIERIEDAVRVAEKVNRPNVGVMFNLCHWLRVDEGRDYGQRLKAAMPRLWAVSINGADEFDEKPGWDRYIQPLDSGTFDVGEFLRTLKNLRYKGPIGLQCYGIGGDARDHLARSMSAWKKLSENLRD